MSKQEVIRLFRAAQTNPNLRETLNSASDLEAFVQMAQQQGYNFTVEEWQKATGLVMEESESQVSEIQGKYEG
ncbi:MULTISPECIES: Nif11-like leader peptide family natural product precursor [Fischerella]|uniref:Nif11-like leader peptide family natural product n=1 Tax=Fischerella muscicola CCMEE 5323 TaxID=2019572 RepID=A0A2N6K001_FISMU|nr:MULTISPECIES: Nif11-like leader peptide family natural product precursor [Fischerella]MBD2430807.1 Nif11-like leader peptide family natural product precursor [Fischerella sp. FACHB-380]PLZ87117.1 Nif11-like leader peptide family natural product precursor [Fischerella muscicola CCMEE 5323]